MVLEAVVSQPEMRAAQRRRSRHAEAQGAATAPRDVGGAVADNDTGDAAVAAQIESLLFVAQGPVGIADLARTLELARPAVLRAIDVLAARCQAHGLRVQRGQGTVRLVTAPESAAVVQRFLGLELATPLTRAALETLSIIAYRQPLTRPEIDDLRGVNSDGVLRTLLARGLVEPVGRRATVGHPFEYGTTYAFLDYFGMSSLDELPPLGTVLGVDPADDASEAEGTAEPAEWPAFDGRAAAQAAEGSASNGSLPDDAVDGAARLADAMEGGEPTPGA